MIRWMTCMIFSVFVFISAKAGIRTDTVTIITQDTTTITRSRQFYLAPDLQQLIDFHDENNLNIELTSRINTKRIKADRKRKSVQEINIDFSFTKYLDSIFSVSEDEIEFKGNWESRSRKVLNTLNIHFKSQLTRQFEYRFINNTFKEILSREFLFPSVLSIGTGFNFILDKNSSINFSPVDIKTTFLSSRIFEFYKDQHPVEASFYYLNELGFSINVSISKSWAKEHFSWRNSSRIFVKSPTKDGATVFSRNRILYELYKSVTISFENQIVYDPLYNYKLQLKNAIEFGVTFGK